MLKIELCLCRTVPLLIALIVVQLNKSIIIFTFAPCVLLHLFYLKPTHALFL